MMIIETGKPETKIVCDWCKGGSERCYHRCFLCKRDVCYDCQDKVGIRFRYSWSFANTVWVCGECLKNNKDDILIGMLYQLEVFFDTRQRDERDKMANKVSQEIEKEMVKRGLKE